MSQFRTVLHALLAGALIGTLHIPVQAEAGTNEIRMGSRLEYYDVVYREGGFDKKYGLKATGVPFATGVDVG